MKKIIADIERVDESTYLKTAKDSGLNLENHYKEYCKTLNSKKKKKHAQNSESDSNSNDYKSYDNWYSDIRNKFKKQIEEERLKKSKNNSVRGFTPDMKHSLKNIKRQVAFHDEYYKTVLLPAELGFIAIICTAGVISGPRVFIFAAILTLFVCYICTKMLVVNRRIDNFVDDFADAVEIDLENIHNIEEHLD